MVVPSAASSAELAPESPLEMNVDRGRGLVQKEDVGFVDEGACQGDALLHSAGESVHRVAGPIGQLAEGDHVVDPAIEAVRLMGRGEEGDVGPGREVVVEGGGLGHVADLPAQRGGVLDGVDAHDAHAAAARPKRADEGLN